ncbi:MAG: molybdopterin molybdenumtransferase MoeA, partial [Actinobacteria bacterium]|nr:molybdopterin molybdenumtransferase MoeA [Actinomycetota bacterium]
MDSVEAYLADITAAIRPLSARELPLAEALGAVLADDVTALRPMPSFDNSAMDGYAVRAHETAAASKHNPVVLPVKDEIAAGDTRRHDVVPGSVMRILTGAPMPAGADAVVPVELTDGGTEQVAITQPVEKGNAVRPAGGDAQPGDLLLRAGTRLGAVHVALLAAAGHGAVVARPRPRVTVIATGNELV